MCIRGLWLGKILLTYIQPLEKQQELTCVYNFLRSYFSPGGSTE